MHGRLPSRRWLVRGLVLALVCSLLAPAVVAGVGGGSTEPDELARGTIASAANGSTVIAVQGFHFGGRGSAKKPARLVGVGPAGATDWVVEEGVFDSQWFYDVDPLPNGDLLVVSTNASHTFVSRFDPATRTTAWTEVLPFHDTHDVDLLDDGRLVVANKGQWNESAGVSDDRVVVWDRAADAVTWEWRFRDHFPADTDGGMDEDWTHVNDVDVLDDGRLLVSPRNYDQVLVVDRETGEIERRLGRDGAHDVLEEAHNPDYLVGADGTPTVIVADSGNDRVVEYALVDGGWERVWSVGGSVSLSWPRDADRLPNGNTLITDTLNHRVVEVTPEGRIVWEYYATWAPYDAERVAHGDGSSGPTMRELGVGGHHELTGSAGDVADPPGPTFAVGLITAAEGTPLAGPVTAFARTWSHYAPWFAPAWLNSWDFAALVGGLAVALAWGVVEVVLQRERIVAGFRRRDEYVADVRRRL